MDQNQLKLDLADDLAEIQSYDTAAGKILERSLLEAARWYAKRHDWPMIMAQTTIATLDGTKGPYAVPADFDRLAGETRLTKYYAYDAADVDPSVQDGQFNRRFEIYLLRSTGVPQIYFYLNPGSRSAIFTYCKIFLNFSDLSTWTEDPEQKACLKNYASFALLSKTPELQGAAANYKALAEAQLGDLWRAFRKGSSRPDNRTPQDIFGQGLYQNHAGEYL